MKKLFTLLLFVFLAPNSIWGQIHGTFTVGTGGNYATLNDAITELNLFGIDGDCTFNILNDLTETSNICVGLNTKGHTITFKPAAGVIATVTFTKTADNTGASGNWVIGVPNLTTTSGTNYGMVTTNNIVIDGSNTVGGTTRDLT
ncbi:MAG: hypothetical protein M0P61_18635, partial [Ignavibacteriaceae bacterium]|nr:hypothetical protein [Ignavibacteriaceae bacterium]